MSRVIQKIERSIEMHKDALAETGHTTTGATGSLTEWPAYMPKTFHSMA
jgi:hypothetical protein